MTMNPIRDIATGGRRHRSAMLALALSTMATPFAVPSAWAQSAPAAAAPSENAMVNLVRLLVAQKVITADKGEALIAQAEAEAASARAVAPSQMAASDLPPPAAGTIRVPYVPESVRAQIRDELKTEVLQQAKTEGWASPGLEVPSWVRRVHIGGDVRFRSESQFFARTNATNIPDFQTISQNGPTDLFFANSLPILNATSDRDNILRLRARLSVDAQIVPQVRVGFRLATGDDRSPISTNTVLGGGFGKKNVWLDLAFIEATPVPWGKLVFGRFENPFRTTEMLFDTDLAFDGVAGEVRSNGLLGEDFDVALRGGAFPLDFGTQNFPSTSFTKKNPVQRYLFAGQVAADARFGHGIEFHGAAGYFYYSNLQGRRSDPCATYLGATECSTDDRAAQFVTKGNTLFPIREIQIDPQLPTGTVQFQPQLLGLVFDYHLLDLNAFASFPVGSSMRATIGGDYVRNLGFKRSALCRYRASGVTASPLNNTGADGNGDVCDATNPSTFVGGNQGYQVSASIGHIGGPDARAVLGQGRRLTQVYGEALPLNRGDWRLFGGYRYVQSDAVLGSLSDSDFHLGGTNAKGYFVGGSYSFFDGVSLGARWLSANEITGEPLAIDVLQVDLQAAF